MEWALPFLEQNRPMLSNLDMFILELQRIFGDPDRIRTVESRLQTLSPGSRAVVEYAAELQRLTGDADWNDGAKAYIFR